MYVHVYCIILHGQVSPSQALRQDTVLQWREVLQPGVQGHTEAAIVVLIVIKTNNTCSNEQSWVTYFPLVTFTNETEAAIVVFMVILNERYFWGGGHEREISNAGR